MIGALQETAAAMQDSAAALQDTVTAHAGAIDSVQVESPLPGGVAEFVRFFFHVPRWIQIGGAVLAGLVILWVLWFLWTHRERIWHWLRTRSRNLQLGLAAVALLLIAAVVTAGTVSWDYMQHDNGFCTGCHVMGPAYEAFTVSEHSDLKCHDCHQQSIWASSRQLVMWVGERPDEIGSHADIPNAICENCHNTGESETWEHIEATAGHRVHLESDDPDLADVTCLTCHAPDVHEFSPVNKTCAQAGCHEGMEITLGGMADQTSLHCATCHEFTVDVAALATQDSAASSLVPNFSRCTSCHQMAEMLANFEPEKEPHGARCGVCHDAHEQTVAEDAAETCAECHDDWRDEPFHVGREHGGTAPDCILCHQPHSARVDASDCAGCHARIAGNPEAPADVRRRLQRTAPFDTAAAMRESRARPPQPTEIPSAEHEPLPRSLGTLASAGDPVVDVAMLLAAPADSFEHSAHEELTCLTCHTTSAGHGGLTFQQPRGCQICHHQAPARSECAECHVDAEELPGVTAELTIHPVPGAEAVHRTAEFAHPTHADLACVECHTTPVTLAPTEEVVTCASCHEKHHAADVTCAGCHTADEGVEEAHAPPAPAHEACAACHTPSTISAMAPDRSFCLTCHQEQLDHEPDGACTSCHLLESPADYRPRLATGDAAGS